MCVCTRVLQSNNCERVCVVCVSVLLPALCARVCWGVGGRGGSGTRFQPLTWFVLFRDVVLPSGVAVDVCLSEDDEASILCNSLEYWSEQKSINTVSQAAMQATQQQQKKTPRSDSKIYIYFNFCPFQLQKRPFLCAFLLHWFGYVYLRLAQENTIL